ncbi:alpha/beta hydrolase family esterase [Corynebacterium sp. A21]|uniref:alpha/beta hydrolase family esterase n=1 Tax=Corynebacterium sp. A21 TaxID=3457318 RepID=UPI003FD635BA
MRTLVLKVAGAASCLLLGGGLLMGCAANEFDHTAEAAAPTTVTMPDRVPSNAPKLTGPAPGESTEVELKSSNRDRKFILSVPSGYSPGERWPIIFAFHGWGENAKMIHAYSNLGDSRAIVVYPQGVDDAWEGAPYAKVKNGEDLTFVEDILASLRSTYSVDDSRIFASGFSNGGGFAALLGCRMNDEFAGVASVSAAYYASIFRDCADTPLALLDIHGTMDPVIDYYGGTRHGATYAPVQDVLDNAATRNSCTGPVSTTRINAWALRQDWTGCGHPLSHIRVGGGGHVWPGAEEDTYGNVPKDYATEQILRFFGVAKA